MDRMPFKLTKELLEERSYERSFVWSEFLQRISKAEDNEVFDIDNIEEIYGQNEQENDCSDSENMAEEVDEVEEEEPTDTTSQDMMAIIQNLTISNARGILEQINDKANETGIIGTEVQKFLEETLPIVEEYKRDWLEAGFERILKTFDLNQIERKVGSWMFQNNSFAQQKYALPFRERFHPYQLKKTHFVRELREVEHDSDSDSLHSDDTARYIRSSKKHLGMQKRVATTTTTIKSYRLVESKRDELRKKYAYLLPDETMQMLSKNHCRQIGGYKAWPVYSHDCHRTDRMRIAPESVRIRRRRHRRRHYNSSYTTNSSSDEELTPRGQKLLKPLCCPQENYHSYKISLPKSMRKKYLKNLDETHNGMDGFLPYLYESECPCREMDKLCYNARHLANSSSDGWLVENCENLMIVSPEKGKVKPKEKSKRPAEAISVSKDDIKLTKTQEKSLENPKKSISRNKTTKIKCEKRTTAKKTEQEAVEELDETFEHELQKALKLSLEHYEARIKDSKSSLKPSKVVEEDNCDNKKLNKTKNKGRTRLDSESSNNQSADETHSTSILATQLSTELKLNNSGSKKKTIKTNSKLQSTAKDKNIKKTKKLNSKPSTEQSNECNGQTVTVEALKISSHSKTQDSEIGNLTDDTISISKLSEQQHTAVDRDDKPSGKTKEVNTPISVSSTSSSSTKTENIRRLRKKVDTKIPTLTAIKESKSEDSDATQIVSKQNRNGNYVNSASATPTCSLSENTTFFASSGNICNSTAVPNHTAISRQMFKYRASPAHCTVPTKQTKKATTSNSVRSAQASTFHNIATNSTENSLPSNDTIQEDRVVSSETNDCAVISSTTDSDLQQQTVVPNTANKPGERVVLYTPKNAALAPDDSIVNGRFKLTEHHLASIIGHKRASKFMKYYVGPREFLQSSTVYYKPPDHETDAESSDSDIDFLDLCLRYGKLDESKEEKKLE